MTHGGEARIPSVGDIVLYRDLHRDPEFEPDFPRGKIVDRAAIVTRVETPGALGCRLGLSVFLPGHHGLTYYPGVEFSDKEGLQTWHWRPG